MRRRKDSCRGWKNVRPRRRLGWLLSREQNCGCLSNPTDRNSISSCISYLPRSLLIRYGISPSRTPFFSPSLAHPPQLFLADSYLFHSRHSHHVRDLSAFPIGPSQFTEISCDAPGRAAYLRTLIRQPSNSASGITQSFPPGHRSTFIRERTASSECARRTVSRRMLSPVDKSFSYPLRLREVSFMIRIASLTRI